MNLVCAFKDVMTTVGGIVIAILILLLMITIHEFGHYIAGRKLGFKINEFAIGFGPKIISKKNKHGIVISLRAFPLGGFCSFEDDEDIVGKYVEGGNERAKEEEKAAAENGEQTADGQTDGAPKTAEPVPTGAKFAEQKPWKRIIVLATGAIFNILSAVIFSFIMLLAFGNVYKVSAIKVAEVYNIGVETQTEMTITADKENPNFGVLKEGDAIISVNGNAIKAKLLGKDISDYVKDAPDAFVIVVKRDGEDVELPIIKWTYTYQEEGAEPVTKTAVGFAMYGAYKNDYNVLTAARDCVPYTFKLAGMVLSALGQLFTSCGIRQMGGTVTTIKVIGQATTTNAANILLLLPLIAVNLGVFNLLPVPALDGCRILICAVEWIRKKPLNRKVEMWIHAIGFLVLIGFVIVADILQLFVFKQF